MKLSQLFPELSLPGEERSQLLALRRHFDDYQHQISVLKQQIARQNELQQSKPLKQLESLLNDEAVFQVVSQQDMRLSAYEDEIVQNERAKSILLQSSKQQEEVISKQQLDLAASTQMISAQSNLIRQKSTVELKLRQENIDMKKQLEQLKARVEVLQRSPTKQAVPEERQDISKVRAQNQLYYLVAKLEQLAGVTLDRAGNFEGQVSDLIKNIERQKKEVGQKLDFLCSALQLDKDNVEQSAKDLALGVRKVMLQLKEK